MSKNTKKENFNLRREALAISKVYVEGICEVFPIVEYEGTSGPTIPFHTPTTYTVTQAEQVVNLMITLSDWLMATID